MGRDENIVVVCGSAELVVVFVVGIDEGVIVSTGDTGEEFSS
jgi:hypothetical protein